MPWRLTRELVIGVQLQVLSESVVLGVAATVSFTLASSKRMHMKKCLWWLQTQKLFFLPAKAALIWWGTSLVATNTESVLSACRETSVAAPYTESVFSACRGNSDLMRYVCGASKYTICFFCLQPRQLWSDERYLRWLQIQNLFSFSFLFFEKLAGALLYHIRKRANRCFTNRDYI